MDTTRSTRERSKRGMHNLSHVVGRKGGGRYKRRRQARRLRSGKLGALAMVCITCDMSICIRICIRICICVLGAGW